MKHLKLFEAIYLDKELNNIINDTNDILLELDDRGYHTHVTTEEYTASPSKMIHNNNNNTYCYGRIWQDSSIIIKIYINFKKFIHLDNNLTEDITRLKTYLNSKNYKDLDMKYAGVDRGHRFYIHDDSRGWRNDNIHRIERWGEVGSVYLSFYKQNGNKF